MEIREVATTGGGSDPAAGSASGDAAGAAAGALGPGPEFDLIRRFLKGASVARPDVKVGPGDDAAVVTGEGIVLSTDMCVEEVHFRREWLSPEDVGYRAATSALSDLAAMGARPIGILVSLAVRADDVAGMAEGIMRGAGRAAQRVGGVVLGGDLARSPGPIAIDVVAVGQARHPVLRSGAREGDEVWVTGRLGGAAAAVSALLAGLPPGAGLRSFVEPVARVREALWLAERGVPVAMLDLSDGLAGDASHIAAASGVAIVLEAASVPVHPAALEGRTRDQAIDLALHGGEDFELCFAARPQAVEGHRQAFSKRFEIELTRVGRVEAGSGVVVEDGSGRRSPSRRGFQHFPDSR